MHDDSRGVAAIIAGAVIGGFAGYLFFTERGRALRRRFEPALEDFAREVGIFRSTIQKAIGAAAENWDTLTEPRSGSQIGNIH